MPRQLIHPEVESQNTDQTIYVACEGIRTPENIGMIFRICEAMGVRKIFFSSSSPDFKNTRVKKISRNTIEHIDFEYTDNLLQMVLDLKTAGVQTIALEITDSGKELSACNFRNKKQIALIIGSERDGISEAVLKAVDECVHIPMYGKNSSMNVATSLGIALYEIRKQEKGE